MAFTLITAAVVEELLFRAYLLPRLELLFKKPYLAIIISSLIFGMAHFSYNSWSQVINAFAVGIIFACFYKKYQDITVLIIAHFVIDFISIAFAR